MLELEKVAESERYDLIRGDEWIAVMAIEGGAGNKHYELSSIVPWWSFDADELREIADFIDKLNGEETQA